jgi:hypothetical protein
LIKRLEARPRIGRIRHEPDDRLTSREPGLAAGQDQKRLARDLGRPPSCRMCAAAFGSNATAGGGGAAGRQAASANPITTIARDDRIMLTPPVDVNTFGHCQAQGKTISCDSRR